MRHCLSRRTRIAAPDPAAEHRVINPATYDATLRQRRNLTVWFMDEVTAGWQAAPRTIPGGHPSYSSLAIGADRQESR